LNLQRPLNAFITACCAILVASAAAAIAFSFRWPLLGDATLMHYVVFLMDHGMAPYRQIVDINLPGSYAPDWTIVHLLGAGALAWHLYDFLLLIAITAASLIITGRRNWTPAVIAGSLFALLHLRDGLEHIGQRDLLLTALLLAAIAALITGWRTTHVHIGYLVFGLCLGATLTIKPILLPAVLCLFVSPPDKKRPPASAFLLAIAGLSIPPALTILWLLHKGSLRAFIQILTTLIPLHAHLGRKPLLVLITHAISLIAPLLVIWLILYAIDRPRPDATRSILLIALAVSIFACLIQAKGYPYQRYPFFAVVLLLISLDLISALQKPGVRRWLAIAGLSFAAFVLAPRSAWLIHDFRSATPLEDALSSSLTALPVSLPHNVQCLDTFRGCIATLNRQRIEQATGILYDCYLFAAPQTPVTTAYRQRVWSALQQSQPAVLIVTDQNCFAPTGSFAKLDTWPQLQSALSSQYRLVEEWHPTTPAHWWAHEEMPRRFRIYLRRSPSTSPSVP
jgi:hypothetical protein